MKIEKSRPNAQLLSLNECTPGVVYKHHKAHGMQLALRLCFIGPEGKKQMVRLHDGVIAMPAAHAVYLPVESAKLVY